MCRELRDAERGGVLSFDGERTGNVTLASQHRESSQKHCDLHMNEVGGATSFC